MEVKTKTGDKAKANVVDGQKPVTKGSVANWQ